ncbi:hypothetical protein Salat_2323200 [Sesamum alatum]|uniref:Uncharacterized protein n=1 Tax=Sesamum alatum TaxID=300844 RepID=A0AAE2CEE1_9LAMI|nr:hypothetical protein Salat_2323200 [Sesamum alatum]
MHSVPSNDLILHTRPHVSSFYGASCSHRLKHLQKSDRRGISSSGSSPDPHNPIQYDSTDISVSDLKTCLTEFLNIEDIGISISGFNLSSGKNDVGIVVKEDECKHLDKSNSGNSSSEKCFSKCATFPPLCGPKSSGDGGKGKQEEGLNDEVSEVNGSSQPLSQCYSRSMSLPTPLKLVSAMKGSCEKQGKPPQRLSVTWAPDVYDPIPTSVSHFPSNKNQRHRSDGKKSGKYKQKGGGKGTRGNKGKDKKQARRISGVSSKIKPFHNDHGVVDFSESQVSAVDFTVGSSDPFCGSSFLKESGTESHFPVAEATG